MQLVLCKTKCPSVCLFVHKVDCGRRGSFYFVFSVKINQ
jgi:hypothetical protein